MGIKWLLPAKSNILLNLPSNLKLMYTTGEIVRDARIDVDAIFFVIGFQHTAKLITLRYDITAVVGNTQCDGN